MKKETLDIQSDRDTLEKMKAKKKKQKLELTLEFC